MLLQASLISACDRVDASRCFQLTRNNAHLLKPGAGPKLASLANSLKTFRDQWAHQDHLSEYDVKSAIGWANALLKLLGDPVAADEARALGTSLDEKSAQLDGLLRDRATLAQPVMTYSSAINTLAWPNDERGRRDLYTRLTASGALQRYGGEPLLCALIVLGEDDALTTNDAVGIPGGGFYWLIGLDRHAAVEEKRAAHRKELERVVSRFGGHSR